MSLLQSYNQLRQKHPQFFYKKYTWQIENEKLKCTWYFHTTPNLDFQPTLTIPLPKNAQARQFDSATLAWLVFNLGLVEMLSYWKATASPEIIIEAGNLTDEQVSWWHELLLSGMGEYFYLNQIDFTRENFVKIVAKETAAAPKLQPAKTLSDSYLIPVGGGKDSIVTLELLKTWQHQHPTTQLITSALNPTQAAKDVIKQSNLSAVFVQRTLDPQLLELNKQGFLNGHTPFSALLAFVNLLIVYLYSYQNIVLSNEQSANEGNVEYLGKTINHQYSKSWNFEQKFRRYVSSQSPANYFSFLRPVNELQIAKIFSQVGQNYFSLFRSCNRGQKTNTWCGQCPKCLFAWSILFPFLGEQQMLAIFGQNLFDNPKLIDTALELIGQKVTKPFDCVGTYQETLVAFYLSTHWYQDKKLQLPYLLQRLQDQEQLATVNEDLVNQVLNQWSDNHNLSQELGNFLQQFI